MGLFSPLRLAFPLLQLALLILPGRFSAAFPSLRASQAVKEALHIPVIGNGNVRHKQDADEMIAETGVDGVMSAEALLEDPALFAKDRREGRWPAWGALLPPIRLP